MNNSRSHQGRKCPMPQTKGACKMVLFTFYFKILNPQPIQLYHYSWVVGWAYLTWQNTKLNSHTQKKLLCHLIMSFLIFFDRNAQSIYTYNPQLTIQYRAHYCTKILNKNLLRERKAVWWKL